MRLSDKSLMYITKKVGPIYVYNVKSNIKQKVELKNKL